MPIGKTESTLESVDNNWNERNDGIDNPAFADSNEAKTGDAGSEEDEEDVWKLPEFQQDYTSWSDLSVRGKVVRVLWHYIGKLILLLGFLYVFICSLSFLGDAFQLLGGKAAGRAFSENKILSNPVAGLMIGVLATVLLQSSSTTTSIVVSMVGGGGLLSVHLAIPIVMGANIGTSVTNTIVSIGQITNKNDFRRAFAGATVHDAFNWLSVLILLPLEVATGYLELASEAMVDSFHLQSSGKGKIDFLKVITKPFTSLIIQIDKSVITGLATGKVKSGDDLSIIKHMCCDKMKNVTSTLVNGTLVETVKTVKVNCGYCKFMFESVSRDDGWSDAAVGGVLLAIALALLCVCLVAIVKLLHSLLRGQMAHVIRKFINADFPGACSYFTGYLAIAVGAGLTMLVQSSSVFTSSLTPLVGIGVLSVERMYPLTLGSNIGTTVTSILAAFAQDSKNIRSSLQIALCHLLFNISGILIFFPLPFFRPPIAAAKFLGNQTAKYRWFAVMYLIFAFFLLPAAGFGLSVVSWIALAAVFIPIGVILLLVFIIKVIQRRCPTCLPVKLRNWKWLPVYCRSLEPMDRGLVCVTGNCFCCRRLGCCAALVEAGDTESDGHVAMEDTNGNRPENGTVGNTTKL
ncbi:sodium-dependent phosphate transport protein 2B-like isoform X2 [Mya arenaria]|uniref:sodium-dependent phosphate transport protein 2B-like isoform X2 n=1 Tax=Mya arenaria TaxID=6604 RepID=UPI0022E03704|nr:sodium-dependent phosphate transport protein 2B-like isoform X2 [Mya arenaria]